MQRDRLACKDLVSVPRCRLRPGAARSSHRTARAVAILAASSRSAALRQYYIDGRLTFAERMGEGYATEIRAGG